MRGCLSSVSYAILVNDNAKGWVKASRGLRQCDPLSPFLFTIVADVLSRMLLKAEERSVLEGFRVGRNRVRVTHLQFSDDTIFFANSCAEELQTLKSLLLVFGQISGLKVNLDKSNLLESTLIRIISLGVGEGKRDHLVSWDAVCKPRLDGHIVVLGRLLHMSFRIFQVHSVCHRRWGKNSFLGRFVVGDQIFKVQYPRLFRVVTDKNIPISSILGSNRPFTWNFNFRRNLFDSEIEDLERLMRSLDSLSQMPGLSLLFLLSLFGILKSPSKLRPLFGLWHTRRLFQLAKMDWIPPRSISDMMSINYKAWFKVAVSVIDSEGPEAYRSRCIGLDQRPIFSYLPSTESRECDLQRVKPPWPSLSSPILPSTVDAHDVGSAVVAIKSYFLHCKSSSLLPNSNEGCLADVQSPFAAPAAHQR
ncbi:putative mitochondrial protein [Vitis vinifera]|uniref:Putative mitochondrial protein n=1 Tax=Vitis vinifera TaxID=29760 RepID=A0A438J9H5_VITVI|nr:putative mitochondrial protein [Vitis vinifera]